MLSIAGVVQESEVEAEEAVPAPGGQRSDLQVWEDPGALRF